MTQSSYARTTGTVAGGDAVRLARLSKRFGSLTAVDSIDLSIRVGEVVALLGPNGAGKSTTIDMMLGLQTPSEGQVQIYGSDPQSAIRDGRVGALLQSGG